VVLGVTFYLDVETFGQASEVKGLLQGAERTLRSMAKTRRMKPFRRAARSVFQKTQQAGSIVDREVNSWTQQTWAMAPAMGVASWWDVATLFPGIATIGALYNTYQACKPQ
jgi:hypothetical protein